MKLRIETDGTERGTRVVDIATGEELEGVREIAFEWERGYPAHVRISLDNVEAATTLVVDGRVASLR